jgi:hypothetical protein
MRVLTSPTVTTEAQSSRHDENLRWHKWVVWGVYGLTAVILLGLFIQNFIFSSNLNLLGFREIDDVAFQLSLRRMHTWLSTGHIRLLWQSNDYGYGWFYWLPMALLTYPAYLLSQWQHWDWPLIVLPRQVSLISGFATLACVRGIFRQYHVPEWVCAVGVLLLALFPTFGYLSMRFGTVNTVMAFAALSVYWAAKPYSRFQLNKVAIAVAMAGAVKLSGLLIAPIAFGLACSRMPIVSLKSTGVHLLKAICLFVVVLFTLTNPAFWSFKPVVFTTFWQNLNHFIEITKRSDGLPNDGQRFWNGVFSTWLTCFVQVTLFIGLFLKGYIPKRDKIILIFGIVFGAAYLVYSVKQAHSISLYFTALSFLAVLGLPSYASRKPILACLAAGILTVLSIADIPYRIQANALMHHAAYFQKAVLAKTDLELANQLQYVLGDMRHIKKMLVDFTIPIRLNSLSNSGISLTNIYNNFSPNNLPSLMPIDYILLDTELTVGSKSDAEFNALLQKMDSKTRADFIHDRASRKSLFLTKRFNGSDFTLIKKVGRICIFKRNGKLL